MKTAIFKFSEEVTGSAASYLLHFMSGNRVEVIDSSPADEQAGIEKSYKIRLDGTTAWAFESELSEWQDGP
jgi:hypothetical protein